MWKSKSPILITKKFEDADSASNLEFSRIFRYSCRFAYTPFLITGLHPTFSVLKIELFNPDLQGSQKVRF